MADILQQFSIEAPPARGFAGVSVDHRDWPGAHDHRRAPCHCWALYLRVLRCHLEFNETVPHVRRLD